MSLGLRAPARLRARRSYRLEWLDRADARFDALWEAARAEYSIVGERSSAFVQWRLLDNPATHCLLAGLVSRDDPSRLHAYAAVEMEGTIARILDLFGHKAALGPLIDSILPVLLRRGAATVEMRHFGSDDIVATLRSCGFVARDSTRVLVCDVGRDLAGEEVLLKETRRWHITDADEDA